MPMIDADGCLLNVSVEGRDGGPTLMLSNSLGCTLQMWEPQMKVLTQLFRVIRYDRRGHGRSACLPVPTPWSASAATCSRSSMTSISTRCIGVDCRWAAWSDNGLARTHQSVSSKIVLANTACYYPDPTNWLNRIKAVKEGGMASVADTIIAGWLTADFRERDPQSTATLKAMLLATPVQGYLACCEALSTLDQRALLPKIKSPTLVIAGRHDTATPLAGCELIRSNIPRASLTILDAAHISSVEQSHAFTDVVVGFLTQR